MNYTSEYWPSLVFTPRICLHGDWLSLHGSTFPVCLLTLDTFYAF